MTLEERIQAFVTLKEKIDHLSTDELHYLAVNASRQNAWFTEQNIKQALNGISYLLEKEKLTDWISPYSKTEIVPKIVGIVMAGNIPLVGFHDLLSVLIAGHFAAVKPSSDDLFLTHTIINWIIDIEPRFKKNIELRDKLTNIDAVIATGSDNTARYFEYYFKSIPSIIRKNRTSIAVLNGTESEEDFRKLGADIFSYFGLGCRNVSKIYTPVGFDMKPLLASWEDFNEIIHHHKYRNNYDYHKSIYLVNKTPHLDTGYLLVVSTDDLVSPLSVLYHQEYENPTALERVLQVNQEKIQCVVGNSQIPFGMAQKPELLDYADDIDTMRFLTELS